MFSVVSVCLSVSLCVNRGVSPHVGADQVFSVEGGANIRFCQNCTKLRKFWALRARTERARPYIHHYHVIGSVQTCSLGDSLAPPFPQTCWQAGCWPSTQKPYSLTIFLFVNYLTQSTEHGLLSWSGANNVSRRFIFINVTKTKNCLYNPSAQ